MWTDGIAYLSLHYLSCYICRVLDFFKTNVKSVKPYDRGAVLTKLPFDIRSKVLQHLYYPTIKVRQHRSSIIECSLFTYCTQHMDEGITQDKYVGYFF